MTSYKDAFEQRNHFFLKPSVTAKGALVFCILTGALTLVAGLVIGQHTRTWGALLFNTFFFFSIALGGSVLSAIQDVIGAKWGRPIMRIHESFTSFLPVAMIIFFIFFLCIKLRIGHAEDVYSWIKNPESLEHFWGKRSWLQEGWMLGRDVFALVVIVSLMIWQMKQKLARDLLVIAGKTEQGKAAGIAVRDRLRYWSAPMLVVYALCFSLLTFDLLMSLAPTWFSTLWGGWNFAILMQTLLATLMIFMWMYKDAPIGAFIARKQFHDVGKLLHGFTIFFAYLTYAHVLTYWYGNVPEETEYFLHRMHAPWIYIVIIAPLLSFALPLFALIPKPSKWTKQIAVPLSVVVLFAQWLTYLLVVMPEVVDSAQWNLPWLELGMFFGILGLFLFAVFSFSKKYPMLAVGDALLPEALEEGHH